MFSQRHLPGGGREDQQNGHPNKLPSSASGQEYVTMIRASAQNNNSQLLAMASEAK
jgi:hypothetical protein